MPRIDFSVIVNGINDGTIMQTAQVYPWRTPFNYYQSEEEGEKNVLPSITEPNQALSLQDILKRHTSGRPIDAYIRPGGFYDYNPDINQDVFDTFQAGVPNLATLDYAEKEELMRKTKQYAEDQKKIVLEKKAAAEEKRKLAQAATQQPNPEKQNSPSDGDQSPKQ